MKKIAGFNGSAPLGPSTAKTGIRAISHALFSWLALVTL
jgi:hypothetical protein